MEWLLLTTMVQWNCAEKRVENVSLAIFQPQWRKSISWATRITSWFLLGLFILDVSQNEGFIFVSFLGSIVFMLGEVSPKSFKFQATNVSFRSAHLHFLRSHRWRTIWALRLHGHVQPACQLGGYWLCMDDLLGSNLGTIGGNKNSVFDKKALSLSTGYNSILVSMENEMKTAYSELHIVKLLWIII